MIFVGDGPVCETPQTANLRFRRQRRNKHGSEAWRHPTGPKGSGTDRSRGIARCGNNTPQTTLAVAQHNQRLLSDLRLNTARHPSWRRNPFPAGKWHPDRPCARSAAAGPRFF